MSDLGLHWLRPLWLLPLPLLGALLWVLWHRQKRAGRWQQILPPAFQALLLSGGHGRASRLPVLALGLAWLLAVLALLGPSGQRVEQMVQKPADPLVILLELSPEMLATDVAPNRLEQARRKLVDLLRFRHDSQTAIIVYSGSAHVLVPLSDDLDTSRNLLEALKPSIMPATGHRADLAVARALNLLDQGGLGQGRILLIGASLSGEERQGIARQLGRQAPPLLMLGIGSADGAPVKQENGDFLKDRQGAILLSRLDAPSLKDFLNDMGGQYRSARLDDHDLRELGLLDNPHRVRSDGQAQRLDSWADQGHWLLLPLLLIAACAGRRGWLFCLPLLWCLPQPSYAMNFDSLWLRPDQQGQRLLEEQRPAQAARRFEDPQWQGMALYEAGNYAAAAQRFAEGNRAADHYNRGNALARQGELEAALDAYERALELQPDLLPAQKNQALIEKLLREKQPSGTGEAQIGQNASAGQPTIGQNTPPSENSQPVPPQDSEQSTPQAGANSSETGAQAGSDGTPGNTQAPPDEQTTRPPPPPDEAPLNAEQRLALEQWLRQIPDDPSELLKRKFWYEQQQRQDKPDEPR
ncbi:VWA domain-containing protein [Pseudomonas sp. nanlin1]|uniref:VWA domain-containing protein n=1 Tax=Pseudomonas sp. nanlin1 TaxID=3040605 RepID=UPI00388F8B89